MNPPLHVIAIVILCESALQMSQPAYETSVPSVERIRWFAKPADILITVKKDFITYTEGKLACLKKNSKSFIS